MTEKNTQPGQDMDKNLKPLDKWFPPRQVLLKSRFGVRYFTLSPVVQKFSASVLLMALLWGGYATFNTLFRDQIISAKDGEIAALEAESAKKERDIETLQSTILEKTEALEKRQGYLNSILENDPTGALPKPEDEDKDKAKPARESHAGPTPGLLFASANAAIAPAKDYDSFLRHITARLDEIAAEQKRAAEKLNAFARRHLLDIDDMLAPFKLTAADLAGATAANPEFFGQGGPYLLEPGSDLGFSPDDDFAALQENWTTLLQVYTGFKNIPLYEPVKDFYKSSNFGRRKDPFTQTTGWHSGIDLAGWPGTPIYATTSGVITKAGSWGNYGRMVEVDHGNGFKTRYAHLKKITVRRGQTVNPGDILGEMGCSGRCASTHLHYEVYFNDTLRNPQPFMEAPEDVQQAKERPITPETNAENGD